jgi:hypothetical protein
MKTGAHPYEGMRNKNARPASQGAERFQFPGNSLDSGRFSFRFPQFKDHEDPKVLSNLTTPTSQDTVGVLFYFSSIG